MQFEEIVALLPDYLDNKLSPQQRQIVEQELAQSTELNDMLNNLRSLNVAATSWQDEAVPEWHRTAFLARQRKPAQTNWMNWFSLATSFAAICLVVFRIEIVASSDGLQIGFGEPTTSVAFEQRADEYLQRWAQNQEAYVSQQLMSYENRQLKRDQQIMTSVLEVNREQRKQDIQQLTTYFTQQRNQDLLLTQQKYQELYEFQDQDRQDIRQLYASLNN